MSKMTKRVARAIDLAFDECAEKSGTHYSVLFRWVDAAARAAVAEMNEPTKEMVEAGTHEAVLNQDRLTEEGIPEIWRAMNDAALK